MTQHHFLIIRFSSIGDIILSTPIAAQLKLTYPNCRISFLTLNQFTVLLRGIKYIDQVIGVDKGKGFKGLLSIIDVIKTLNKTHKIHFIIDHHASLRSFMIRKFFFYIPSVVMHKHRLLREIFLKFKMNLLKNELPHALRHVQEWGSLFNYQFDQKTLAQFIGTSDEVVTLSPIKKNHARKKQIVILPGASFAPKRWPILSFKQLVQQILNDSTLNEYKVVLLAGKEDDFCRELDGVAQLFPDRFSNYQGKLSLLESLEIINQSALVVGNDTGFIHAAESLAVNVISIMGPTHESFGFKPYLSQSRLLSKSLWCRPCSLTGSKKCFRNEAYCFTMIKPNEVLANLKQIL